MAEQSPILVTGVTRSGTTILGEMLSLPPGIASIYEPFNAHIGKHAVERQFVYVTEGSLAEAPMARAVAALLDGRGRFHRSRIPHQSVNRGKRLLRAALTSRTSVDYRIAALDPRRTRWLLKDPLAAFSAEWLHRRFRAATVITVRHPAATVDSYLRLGWRFYLGELQADPHLMRDHLEPVLGSVDAGSLSACRLTPLPW